MAYFWFIISFIFVMQFFTNRSYIKSLKKKIDSLEMKIKDIQQQEAVNSSIEKIEISKPDHKTTIPSETTEAYKVDYMEALYLQERKIESKYLHPIKDLEDKSHFFYGKKVVITGLFDDYEDRNDLAKLFWEAGADIDGRVGKYTEFLIVGDDAGAKKIKQAKEQSITIIKQQKLNKYFS